jgi:hypothetical protein
VKNVLIVLVGIPAMLPRAPLKNAFCIYSEQEEENKTQKIGQIQLSIIVCIA